MHASAAVASPPRATFPTVSRIHEKTDRRTRELAEAMVRLKAEHPDGCTETTLQLEGFSLYEQRQLGIPAQLLANGMFVRQDHVEPAPPTDEQLLDEALTLHQPMLDRLLVKLRARPHFNEDALARLWPRIATGLATRIAKAALPARIAERV